MDVRALCRTGRTLLLAAAAVTVTGLAAPSAFAQSIGLSPSTPVDLSLSVPSAEVLGDGTLGAALTAVFSSEPFVVVLPSQVNDSVVTRRTELALGVSYSVWHRLLVAVNLPTVLAQSGEALAPSSTADRVATGVALGDTNLTLRGFVVGTERRRLGFSLQGDLWLPTGSTSAYASDDRVRVGLAGLLGGRGTRYRWVFEVGGHSRREGSVEGIVPYRLGHEVVAGAAGQVAIDAVARLWVGSELRAYSAVTNGAEFLDPRSSRGLWLASLMWRVQGSALALTGAAGPGLGDGVGAADWQALVRVAWAPAIEPPLPDADEDGIADASDACRDVLGTSSLDPKMHGCPDLPTDEDGDGIPFELDACPTLPGLPSAIPKLHGCPKVPPTVDTPNEPKPEAKPLAEVVAERIVLHQQVQFETGTAELKPESAEVLSQVAAILVQHPELERIEVQGHTDEVGTADFNHRLSLARARAVVHWLTQHGVVADRLVARGFGAEVPIASNATEQGRRANRRVEFHELTRVHQVPHTEPRTSP